MSMAHRKPDMDTEREFPLSPRSSSCTGESPRGTPEIRSTVSPNENERGTITMSAEKNMKHVLTKKDSLGTDNPNAVEKDPFVTHEDHQGTRLSPTASSFSPIFGSVDYSQSQSLGPISTISSTELGVSRAVFVEPQNQLPMKEARSWIELIEAHGRSRHGNREIIEESGGFLMHFSDVRDACSAYVELQLFNKGWRVSYVTKTTRQSSNSEDGPVSDSGQVTVQVMVTHPRAENANCIVTKVKDHLQKWGCLFAFSKTKSFSDGSFQAVAEFCEMNAAATALSKGKNVKLEEIGYFTTSPCEIEEFQMKACAIDQAEKAAGESWPLQLQSVQSPPVSQHGTCINPQMGIYPFIVPTGTQNTTASTIPYVLDTFINSPPANTVNARTDVIQPYRNMNSPFQTPPSPALTAQNSFSPSRSGTEYSRSDGRRQNAMRVNRSSFHNLSSHHNHVDVARIREGIDVRTTIMLRNIPNKVDQTMLKRIVDESSWGKYDFMYLRIDFANDCNVGYAFINFVDPLDIIDFVEARGNQRWNCFKSDKVAEISYATIQGKDCLVQKFRNSSVMLEAAHYRPKLYFTSNGPVPEMAGQEEPFPDPDNQSKMKRSCENAEHVGLFTPNAGQHFRDEQRRRRSQYDRGTRLAALEEYDYEAAIQQLSGIQIP